MTFPHTDTYLLQIAGCTDTVVRTQPTPRNAAERSGYRATLVTILSQQLHVTLATGGDPEPWKRFAVQCSFEVPQDLELTADGWVRLAIRLAPSDPNGRPLGPAMLAFWRQSVPPCVPVLARLSQAVDGSLLAVEWRLPAAPPPRLVADSPAGAVCLAAPRPARLCFHIPAVDGAMDLVAEAIAQGAGLLDSPRRPAPRSLAVTRALADAGLPSIRFSGRWLARLGFTPGQRARVTAEAGRIVLTLDNLDRAGRYTAGPEDRDAAARMS